MKDSKILIVEDEESINRLIELVLISDGYYKISKAFDGEEALNSIKVNKPDLILLDIMIPKIDGLSLCKIIKEDLSLQDIPVIMLTAKKMEEDILSGFESGAIDYITKPFNNNILLARINAHLKNSIIKKNKIYKDFSLDEDLYEAKLGERKIKLTHFEFELMKLFVTSPGRVFSRSCLLEHLRGNDGYDVSERAVDVQILNLRKKFGDFGKNIETVRGAGYKLKEPDNE